MINPLVFIPAGLFGALIGAAYFWLLWQSAQAIASSQRPWRVAVKSGGLRMALLFSSCAVLVLFGAQALELLAWLAGFLMARLLAVRIVRPAEPSNREAIS